MKLERLDRLILQRLQNNCRQSIADIADQIGISTSACHRRIKQLEDVGIIQAYVARLSSKKLDYSMHVLVEIGLTSQSTNALNKFERAVENAPEILECHLMAGDGDYILRVAVNGLEGFEEIHRKVISKLPGVARVKSNIELRTIKSWQGLNI